MRLAVWLLVFACIPAVAARPIWELHVKEPLTVFIEPNELTNELVRLEVGQVVVVSPRIYDGFRKVLVTVGSRKRSGYVPMRKIRLSTILERGVKKASLLNVAYNEERAFGFAVFGSHLVQPGTGFEETDGLTVWNFSPLKSTTFFFSLFADLPYSDTLGFRAYVAQRTTDFSGTAKQDSPSPTPTTGPVTRKQVLTGIGMVAKLYPQFGSWWWWGGGIELAKGNSVELTLNGIQLITTDEDLPFFLNLFGAVGGDFMIREHLYFVPDLRLGIVATVQPITYMVESMMGVSYRF